jgi:Na+-driven multidrug efflux pump
MRVYAAPALWLLRRTTGVRLHHVVGLVLVLVVSLAALAVPFWWLAEQVNGVLGPVGFAIAALLYLYAAVLALGVAAALIGRVLLGRIRRTFA